VLPRSADKFRRLFEGRTSIERLFAHMKQYGALDTVTVRYQERVALHVDLHMTAQLVLTRGRPRAR
jgi:hypothetical protein